MGSSLPGWTWGVGMKKIIAVVFLILLSGILIVIGSIYISSQEKNKVERIKIGVSVYNQYDTFIASLMEQMKSCAVQKENETDIEIIVDIVNAAGSQLEQNDQVEKFVNNGYDVFCVNLVNRTDPTLIIQGEMIVDLLKKKKESVDKNADNKIQYIMLEGEAGHQDAIIRTEYAVNTIVENGIQVEKLSYALKTGQSLPEDIVMTEEKYIRYSYKKVTKENVEEFIRIH